MSEIENKELNECREKAFELYIRYYELFSKFSTHPSKKFLFPKWEQRPDFHDCMREAYKQELISLFRTYLSRTNE